MKYRCFLFIVRAIATLCFFCGCKGGNNSEEKNRKNSTGHVYKNIFGEEYYATGHYQNNNKDSIETNLWFISNVTSSMVIYGEYLNGLQAGDWKFGFKNGYLLSTQWSQYYNATTKCSFSLPFQYSETIVNSNIFRLRTVNDSLGKISIIVCVSDIAMDDRNLEKFGVSSESELRKKGYSFKGNQMVIRKTGSKYFFTEYFMKDSANKAQKLYHLYGYTPSKQSFVEFTLFHDGPKDEIVRIIYDLMSASVYINGERVFNPHLN